MFDNLNYKKKKGFEREREKEFTIDRRVRDLPTRTKLHYLFSEYFSLSFVILIQNLIEFLGFSTFFLVREREREREWRLDFGVCEEIGGKAPFISGCEIRLFISVVFIFRGCTAFERIWAVLIWFLHESLIY